MSGTKAQDYFSKGPVTRDYFSERNLQATGAAALKGAAIPSAPCPQCQKPMRGFTTMRDMLRAIHKVQIEGVAVCAQCGKSAFRKEDIGLGRRSFGCVVCETILCPSCGVTAIAQQRVQSR